MNKNITKEIAKLLKSTTPEKDLEFLIKLQSEQAPWLNTDEVLDCVIFSLVKCYNDHRLSYMWHCEHSFADKLSRAA